MGQLVDLEVFEDDGVLGVDAVSKRPVSPVKFGSDNKAVSSWLTEFQVDGFNGIGNPPEYFFNAQVQGSGAVARSSTPDLQVIQMQPGTFKQGDANRDNSVDLVDMSIMLSQWNKTTDFNDELDTNGDNIINTFDFASLVQLLILNGVVKSQP